MKNDKNKKLIGTFKNGATVYSLMNNANVPYCTIEVNGVEFYSTEIRDGKPQEMIRFYEDFKKTKFIPAGEEK